MYLHYITRPQRSYLGLEQVSHKDKMSYSRHGLEALESRRTSEFWSAASCPDQCMIHHRLPYPNLNHIGISGALSSHFSVHKSPASLAWAAHAAAAPAKISKNCQHDFNWLSMLFFGKSKADGLHHALTSSSCPTSPFHPSASLLVPHTCSCKNWQTCSKDKEWFLTWQRCLFRVRWRLLSFLRLFLLWSRGTWAWDLECYQVLWRTLHINFLQ